MGWGDGTGSAGRWLPLHMPSLIHSPLSSCMRGRLQLLVTGAAKSRHLALRPPQQQLPPAAVVQVPAAGMVLCFWWADLPQFRGPRLAAAALLLWAFSLAALPLTYLLQFAFTVCGAVRSVHVRAFGSRCVFGRWGTGRGMMRIGNRGLRWLCICARDIWHPPGHATPAPDLPTRRSPVALHHILPHSTAD